MFLRDAVADADGVGDGDDDVNNDGDRDGEGVMMWRRMTACKILYIYCLSLCVCGPKTYKLK